MDPDLGQFTLAPASVSVPGRGPSGILFSRYLASSDLPFVRSSAREPGGSWGDLTKAVRLSGVIETLIDSSSISSRAGNGVFKIGEAIVHVESDPDWGGWDIQAVGPDADAAVEAVEIFVSLLPPVWIPETENKVQFNIWMAHPMVGAMSRRSTLDLVPWTDVEANYPGSVRSELADLASFEGPPSNGRLFVFHGAPGTGKTRFLQTLASEWSSWCDLHYIMDPDKMFSDASYLNSIVMDGEHSDRWGLLVLEDGDEFIDVGAKAQVGQGLSRLLNMADGFLGQATKTMVLISTNVEHDAFQPAAIRAGRCSAKIEFPSFSLDEAAEWLGSKGYEGTFDVSDEPTLAELYDHLR